jgi:Fe-S cluster biogenesis protein NfuA
MISDPSQPQTNPMSKLDKIESALESLRPALRMDGGDVELVGYDDQEGVVHVRLLGACGACPISSMTMKHGIERRIRAEVPEVREVLAV